MPIEMLKSARGMMDGKVVLFEAGRTYSKAEGTINGRLASILDLAGAKFVKLVVNSAPSADAAFKLALKGLK